MLLRNPFAQTLMWGWIFLLGTTGLQAGETPGAVVPLWLPQDAAVALDAAPGDALWLEVRYRVHPQGEAVHVESAEKVWWIQERPLLVLGAAGYPLPEKLLSRTVAWISVHQADGTQVSVMTIHPRRDRISLGVDSAAMSRALKKGLGDVNASYLAQVAHFLAGNLAALDVQGSSFSVTGVGEVIDSSGAWVGPPISGTGLWSEGSGGIFYDAESDANDHVGIATTDGAATLTVGGDDGVLFTGAFNQGNIPSEGAGTRLMWYPRKAAFRVGQVSSTTWNDVNVGSRSMAAGFNTTASGSAATALGDQTAATGSASAAMGLKATANGTASLALGNETTAESYASLVLGQFNLLAGSSTSWVATDPALVIGNGTSINLRANALTAYKNGNFEIAGVGTQPSGGTWAAPADRRLLAGVSALAPATSLDSLTALAPVSSLQRAFGDEPSQNYTGFLAEDVAALFPEWVVTLPIESEAVRNSLGTATVKGVQLPQAFFAHLVAALKELKERNEMLEARITALENP
ncbi:hypothetical protein [Acanthopleuribacter pedis]|uniref:Peptidase S74 domain-containing protein n=1 Tax=Acanthopleuribacter pedis TaxID=442870 RepID=A0A8J7U5B3_9BACT|nr:hypothetical protein [Acanthopleuribacter pedis]MBO1322368.1 hypothetical protein [Acanthopleuribacter pedis]